jgi:hypothetical protein
VVMSRTKFKVGDRVAVYDNGNRDIGTVSFIDSISGRVTVIGDDSDQTFWFHPKQCRKLRAKKPKPAYVWVALDKDRVLLGIFDSKKKAQGFFVTDLPITIKRWILNEGDEWSNP